VSDYRLILFVTGEAPRSQRARANLDAALERLRAHDTGCEEVDLIQSPQRALDTGIFATPALALIDARGNQQLLYGDLSDDTRVDRFLTPVAGRHP